MFFCTFTPLCFDFTVWLLCRSASSNPTPALNRSVTILGMLCQDHKGKDEGEGEEKDEEEAEGEGEDEGEEEGEEAEQEAVVGWQEGMVVRF